MDGNVPHDAIRIRLANRNDAEVIAGHRLSMFKDMGTLPAGADIDALYRSAAAYLRDAIGSEYFGWLACAGDDIAGGCGMQLRRILPRFSRGGAASPKSSCVPAWRGRTSAASSASSCTRRRRGGGSTRSSASCRPTRCDSTTRRKT